MCGFPGMALQRISQLLLRDNERGLFGYTLGIAMDGVPAPYALRSAIPALVACALALLAGPGMAVAGTDPSKPDPPKPSSFAPHHTTRRAFGAPIQTPILHKRHQRGKVPSKATGTASTGKKTVASRPSGHRKPSK
jgi:hypothetical protein